VQIHRRQICVKTQGCIVVGKGGDAPAPPDYTGAAIAQGAANVDAARATAKLSNPSFSNPFGSRQVSFGYGGDPDSVHINDTLSAAGQNRFNQNERIDTGLGNLAETGLGFVQNTLNTPFNQSNLPQRVVNPGQTGQQAIMARLQPQIERRTDALENKLVNQGLVRGSEAFGNAMSDQGQIDNDLMSQAALHGIGLDDQARSKAISEEEFFRTEPLNILNAVRSASPVNIPQFQNYSGGGNVAAAPIFNAATQQGNAAMQQYNAGQMEDAMFMQGLMQLGGSAMGSPWAGKMFGMG
jgi:hypothetical protein